MKAKVLVLFIAVIMAMTVVAVANQSDDADAADVNDSKYGNVYKLTYYAEIEGETVSEKSVAVAGGTQISMYAIPAVDGYTFVGWEYNGDVYEVGEKFVMPEGDTTLNAKWESAAMADAVVVPEDATMIVMIVGALFAISAIIGAVAVMKMRASALRSI